jgi:hypothetical protein
MPLPEPVRPPHPPLSVSVSVRLSALIAGELRACAARVSASLLHKAMRGNVHMIRRCVVCCAEWNVLYAVLNVLYAVLNVLYAVLNGMCCMLCPLCCMLC